MKKVYLIQYKETTKDNAALNSVLTSRIKSFGSWVNYFTDSWLVHTNLTPKQMYDQLAVGYDKTNFFIIRIDNASYWGRMDPKVWDWLKGTTNPLGPLLV